MIQWFPGHMARARREVTEKLKLVDIVFELVDARIPQSSSNPMLKDIIQNKPRLVLLNKADIADQTITDEWIDYYMERKQLALAVNSHSRSSVQAIVKSSQEILHEKFERMRARGRKPRAIRAMIVGIPNVGKSTLINRLAGRNIAKTGNNPGVTKAQQWIKVGKELELLDTPGILWPKFDDEKVGYKLALTGAIKDSILNLQDIALFGLQFLRKRYPDRLKERYQLEQIPEDIGDLFYQIGEKRGCLMAGGVINEEKTAEIIMKDIRSQKFGLLSMDTPQDHS